MQHSLSTDEKEYYLRHFSLPGFNEQTQLKLKAARVLVIGSGGLGAPCLQYLAGAGIGHIGIADHDTISCSNLPRQVLFSHRNIGESKAEKAGERISALNPFIPLRFFRKKSAGRMLELLSGGSTLLLIARIILMRNICSMTSVAN